MSTTFKKLVTITVKQSNNASLFLAQLKQHKISIYQLNFHQNSCTFQVAHKHLSIVRKLRKKTGVKISVRYSEPEKVLQSDLQTLIGMLMLLMMPFVLSHFIWKVEVDAQTIELEDDVMEYLRGDMGLGVPAAKKTFLSDNDIRQSMMRQFREFSWVHIIKSGSHVTITPQLAPKIEPLQKPNKNQHLVAANSGIVTHFQIERGIRQVEQNMTVYRDDLLVSGILTNGDKEIIIGAAGQVFVDYWLETSFSIPKTIEMHVLDDFGWKYNVQWQQLKETVEKKSLQPLETFITYEPYRMFHTKEEMISEDDIETFILPLLHEKMMQSLPAESAIKAEKLLHVYADDVTVKGKVLYLVNENIAKPHPIHQGE